ncbi:MAG: hypothetical protein CME64_01320 [Halobacteriovoraceae bacterium]|nr:hypothetical protein [Halobacteriovoraceae bacterium]|tara:strand:- start:14681 stop:15184 length:504 start_codon:yes stop_codon:yes gene_type:complete
MKRKHYIALGIVAVTGIVVGWKLLSTKDTRSFVYTPTPFKEEKVSEQSVVSKETIKTEEKAPARNVASIPAPKKQKWRKGLDANLKKHLSAIGAKASVKKLGRRTLPSGSKHKEVLHVLVSIDAGKGNISSYEAYVNPESGSILKTWNQTRFENKKPMKLSLKPFRP